MLDLITGLVPWEWLVGACAVVAGLLVAWWRGWRARGVRAEGRALQDYKDTRKAMDDAETGTDDPAVLRDWLHQRGKSDGNL